MKSNYKKIGDYIELVDERNKDLAVTKLLGLSISKEFIPSVANIVGTDMANYKIIRKGQFACSIMQVRRDRKMPIALLRDFDEAIISQAYPIFQVKDERELLPEYLMMWFSRSEFDRHACFLAVGGVRGSLEWDDFLEMEFPVPHPDKQREIVAEYNTVVNRIKLNEQLNQKLEETAQALYKHWFVDFEFPNEKGKPYKSSGGNMLWNEELDKEIPEGWEVCPFTRVVKINGGGTPSTLITKYWKGEIPFYTPGDLNSGYYAMNTEKSITDIGLKNCSSKLYPKNTTFLTARGATVGGIGLASKPMAMNQTCYALTGLNVEEFFTHQFSRHIINEIKNQAIGATFEALVTKDFDQTICLSPAIEVARQYNSTASWIYNEILNNSLENQKLLELSIILLAKMTKVELEKGVF